MLGADEHALNKHDDEWEPRGYVAEIAHYIGHQLRASAEERAEVLREDEHYGRDDGHHEYSDGHRLGHVDVGGLDVAVREVERRHDRDTASEHHREPGADHEDRGCHVDGGKRVASHAAADEDAVRKVKDSREQEPQECRDKKPDKE